MSSLERNFRKALEKAVKSVRRVAEGSARKAIVQFGVGEVEASKHLTADQRALRNRLRTMAETAGNVPAKRTCSPQKAQYTFNPAQSGGNQQRSGNR